MTLLKLVLTTRLQTRQQNYISKLKKKSIALIESRDFSFIRQVLNYPRLGKIDSYSRSWERPFEFA